MFDNVQAILQLRYDVQKSTHKIRVLTFITFNTMMLTKLSII